MKSPQPSVAILIRDTFPPVSRPPDTELTVHGDECFYCSALIEAFKHEKGELFSAERARWLLGELSLLSPSGFRWILPSYLTAIFADEANLDLGEFLAYHFCRTRSRDEEAEREARMAVLSSTQLDCLIHLLLLIRSKLGSAHHESVDEAISFLRDRRDRRSESSAPERLAGIGAN